MASAIGGCRPTAGVTAGPVPLGSSGPSSLSGTSGPLVGPGAAGGSVSGFVSGSIGGSSLKPVPMKLFATWEVDRTPPNCIPRLCTLTLTRLVLHKPLGSELTSVIVAVKMQSSKRTLRSNEILLPASGLLDTELQLNFSLQYPHFLKRDGNHLHIMLQRRKKYKNRTILGFKTLADGIINMSQVLQKQMDLELELYNDVKEKTAGNAIGKVYMLSLSSQPVDHEDPSNGAQKGVQEGSSERVEMYSDEDEEFSSPEEGSDSEPMLEDIQPPRRLLHQRKARGGNSKSLLSGSAAARQRNLKQKFVALLKKFKVTDPEDLDNDQVETLDKEFDEGSMDPADIEDLFDQLEDLSDSGQDVETVSIGSTPKPSLKPFFCSSRNLLHEARSAAAAEASKSNQVSDRQSDESSKEGVSDSHPETWTDPEFSDPPFVTSSPPQSGDEVKKEPGKSGRQGRLFPKEINSKAFSLRQQHQHQHQQQRMVSSRDQTRQTDTGAPRKVLLEQLSRLLPGDSDSSFLPDQIILANTGERQAAHVAAKLEERGGHRVVCTAGPADVRATLTCLVAKIQRFCNTKTQSPPLVKVVLIGSDFFINSLLRPYVEVFSSKPPDWQGYVRFFVVPLGGVNSVAKYIGSHDAAYSALFLHESWKELLEKAEPRYSDVSELVSRIEQYISSCGPNTNLMHLPVAEAMVTYKEKGVDEESSQVFVPFISDVRVGVESQVLPQSFDNNEDVAPSSSANPAASSTGQPASSDKRLTPPSSPHVGSTAAGGSSPFAAIASSPGAWQSNKDKSEVSPMDLQLDYWTVFPVSGNDGGSGGASLAVLGGYVASTSSDPTGQKSSSGGNSGSMVGDNGAGCKYSIKSSIWCMRIQRLGGAASPGPMSEQQPTFSMQYRLKEKKQKTVMRLGKRKEKEKDSAETKSQNVDGITRLICLSKAHHPLRVHIDGSEWSGVKFFQLSSLWQTHIKYFPVATFIEGTQTIP